MTKPKEITAWATATPNGLILAYNTSYSSKECRAKSAKSYGCTWRSLYKEGYRVIKVKIVPVEE